MKRASYRELDLAFGQHMLALRTTIGLTQERLAEMLGVSRHAVGGWESGQSYPKADRLKRLIELGVQQGGFNDGQAEAEIRALWRAARQKALLDEGWLRELLQRQAPINPPSLREAALSARPLPLPPTPCIGREGELAQLAQLLADPTCRVLTICGPGGIGKTRLALEVVVRQGALFQHGAAFVELASVSAVNQIASTIGEALRLLFVGQDDPIEHLLHSLQPLHLLLVLDNLEHIPDGGNIINAIVQYAPHVKIVTTSRERLKVRAEWVFDIEGLAYPQNEAQPGNVPALVAEPTSYSAVRLFVQQVRHVQPNFSPSDSDIQAIVRICQQLNGMPLAIELAAAWKRVMSITEIEQQLHTDDLLTTTLRDVPQRHRSLRAVFDQSWATLSEREQALFARLAVFRGGCTLAAANTVAAASAPLLAELVDKSLVRGNTEVAATQRFSMLEPIREYALQRLTQCGERAAIELAHAHYYLTLCEASATPGSGATEQGFDQIEHDYDNMRAALRWALDTNKRAFGLRLAEALWLFWRRRGYLPEGRQWLADLMALPPVDASPMALHPRPPGREALAWLASDEQSFAQAVAQFEQGFTLQRAMGHADALTDVLISGARQARNNGDYARATLLLERELDQYRALVEAAAAPQGALVPLLQECAMVMREQGDYARSQALWQECLELQLAHGDRVGIAVAQMGLSDIARDRGDAATIRAWCEQSLPVFRAIGEERGIGYCLNNLALAALMNSDLDQAAALIEECVTIFSRLEGGPSLGEALLTRGRINTMRGGSGQARQDLHTALRIAWVEGPHWLLAAALEALGECSTEHEAPQAARLLGAATHLRRASGTPIRPVDRATYDHAMLTLRAKLGAQRVDELWVQAATVPLEQIIGAALAHPGAEDSAPG